MRIRVGCAFLYEATWPAPAVLLVKSRDDDPHRILHASWQPQPDISTHDYYDLYRNRCQRLTLPVGPSALTYDAVVEISGDPDEMDEFAIQPPVEELPDDVVLFTLPSRYCLSDALSNTAWELFGGSVMGWARVQAVCEAMDFHAWFEVYLGGRWWTFDARFNTPRIGRIPIGRGRDAVDVAMVTTYGAAKFRQMTVWSDVVSDATEDRPIEAATTAGETDGGTIAARHD